MCRNGDMAVMPFNAATSSFSNGSAAPRSKTAPSARMSFRGCNGALNSNRSCMVRPVKGSIGARADGPRASRLPGAFPVEQDAFPFDSPRISRKRTVDANHPVTGNGDREVVLGTRTGDRAHRFWRSDTPRDLGIRNGLADRNLLKRLPHTPLE